MSANRNGEGRKRRTLYFNDARHYYLFVFEPPMRLEDAWQPVDEVAGTAVDTFVYGVSRSDGLFYPSRVGMRFGADMRPFDSACYWRVWQNMQSLIDRGLDPLRVLIDRAHAKGMDFFASLRVGGLDGMDRRFTLAGGGRGFAHPEVRDHQLAVLAELAGQYPVEGVELDFAAAPLGSPFWLRDEEMAEHTPTMTEFVRRTAEVARGRKGTPGQVGARVYPTEELNLKVGLDVRAWLEQGLVDYVVPIVYGYMVLDANLPIDWLVEAAHARGVAVYPMLQPYCDDESRARGTRRYASPAMMRAAAANFHALGADGLYTWFMRWPLGPVERSVLTELGDPERVGGKDKHYFLRWRSEATQSHDYPAWLPLAIPGADPDRRHPIPFAVADDPADDRLTAVHLRLGVDNLVTDDCFLVWLNGQPLAPPCRRAPLREIDPYSGQLLEFSLERPRPRRGGNLLEVALAGRPDGLAGGVAVETVELLFQYDIYPAGGRQGEPHG
jgi:hypothetical protein